MADFVPQRLCDWILRPDGTQFISRPSAYRHIREGTLLVQQTSGACWVLISREEFIRRCAERGRRKSPTAGFQRRRATVGFDEPAKATS